MQTIYPHPDSVCQETAGIRAAYYLRMQSLQLQMRDAQSGQRALLFALAVLCLGAVIALCQPWHLAAIVPATIATLLLRRLFFLRKDLGVYSRLDEWYERGIARIDETWQGQGSNGEEFARPGHPYASDLNILHPAA